MIVIIEGTDGVGKTTLCEQIAKRYDYLYVKESYTDDVKEKEKRVQDLLARLMSGINFIYDRTTLIDDFVYSFLNETESTLSKYLIIIQTLLSHCKIIHLTIDPNIQQKRLENRGDEYITYNDIPKIEQKYEQFYEQGRFNNLHYVYLTNDIEENIKKIMEVIRYD